MRFAKLKILLFVAVTASPLVSVVLLGPVGPYGNVARLPEFPTRKQLLNMQPGALDRLAEAALARSAIRRTSIELKNTVNADVVRFIDTPEIVSGTGDWLFLKAELWPKCLHEATLRPAIANLDLLAGLARAAGIDVVVSMSPDKATIYPSQLHPFAQRFWRCKAAGSALLRRLLAEEAPQVIDHAAPILSGRQHHPGHKLYFHTDTHWTPLGGALAFRQLMAHIFPNSAALPEPRLSGQTAMTPTDLRNSMLLLKELEEKELLVPLSDADMARVNSDEPGYKTVVLGDSFYATLKPEMTRVFPNFKFVSLESRPDVFGEPIATADRLIVNSIERALPARASDGILSSQGAVAEQVLKRNMKRAADCIDFAPVTNSGDEHPRTIRPPPPSTRSANRLTCLRFEIDSREARSVALRFGTAGVHPVDGSRRISIAMGAGRQAATLIVPENYAGGWVDIETPAGVTLTAVEVGTIVQPTILTDSNR
ncbi:MAG: hypothetical protein WC829_22140 [Hyphomicrobium sp.]|jgi:hypothetical protein